MLSAIPWIGQDFVQFVWGGFSVNNATLNRFFSLHFVLPFVLSALALVHMMTLHTNGSSNPLGLSSNGDKLPMHPYFLFKDLVTMFVFMGAIVGVVCYAPNLLGHSDNYIPANPMSTPSSIVPEWLVSATLNADLCEDEVCQSTSVRSVLALNDYNQHLIF